MATLSPPVSPPRESLARPRTSSALSFVSNRSHRSSGSGSKMDMTETSKDKKRLHTKADPSKAITEAQPAAVALEDSNLDNLRQMQHKDSDGNVITDPDRSNPTRYRLERPLDTIRSFQAAAEGTSYSRRPSYSSRPPSQIGMDAGQTRRSSYYSAQGYAPPPQRQRPGMGGYYRSSSYGFRPDSFAEEPTNSSPSYNYNYQSKGGQSRHAGGYSSAHNYYNQLGEAPSPSHSHQQSYETMTSGSDENTNKSTNPSSQNSSFDHLQQFRKPDESHSEYNSHFSPLNPLQQTGFMYTSNGNQNSGPGYVTPPNSYSYQQPQRNPTSPLPNNPRMLINLGGAPGQSSTEADFGLKKSTSVKRQSWIKRTFGRRST